MESKSLSFGWEVCCCSFSCWNLDGGRLFMKGPEGSADVIELRGRKIAMLIILPMKH